MQSAAVFYCCDEVLAEPAGLCAAPDLGARGLPGGLRMGSGFDVEDLRCVR